MNKFLTLLLRIYDELENMSEIMCILLIWTASLVVLAPTYPFLAYCLLVFGFINSFIPFKLQFKLNREVKQNGNTKRYN